MLTYRNIPSTQPNLHLNTADLDIAVVFVAVVRLQHTLVGDLGMWLVVVMLTLPGRQLSTCW